MASVWHVDAQSMGGPSIFIQYPPRAACRSVEAIVIFRCSADARPFRQRLEDPPEFGSVSAVVHLLFAILAIIVAATSWMTSLVVLSSDLGPISQAGVLTVLVFLAPILFLVLPWIAQFLYSGLSLVAIWLFALAPVLGGLNIALGSFVLARLRLEDGLAMVVVLWLFVFFWILPLLPALRSAWCNRISPKKHT